MNLYNLNKNKEVREVDKNYSSVVLSFKMTVGLISLLREWDVLELMIIDPVSLMLGT